MANFTTHITFGVALGIASVLATVSLALVPSHDWNLFIVLALSVIVGAIAPDIDSDSGVPFHVTFGSLSLVAGLLAFVYAWRQIPSDRWALVGYPLAAIFIVWVIFGAIFKKFTHHRGMAHSIPAALLAGLLVFTFAVRTGFQEWESFLLGVGLSCGYLLHLILDEVYAGVNLHGTLLVPNKAFGNALKLYCHSRVVNVFVYAWIVFLIAGNQGELTRLATKLVSAVR